MTEDSSRPLTTEMVTTVGPISSASRSARATAEATPRTARSPTRIWSAAASANSPSSVGDTRRRHHGEDKDVPQAQERVARGVPQRSRPDPPAQRGLVDPRRLAATPGAAAAAAGPSSPGPSSPPRACRESGAPSVAGGHPVPLPVPHAKESAAPRQVIRRGAVPFHPGSARCRRRRPGSATATPATRSGREVDRAQPQCLPGRGETVEAGGGRDRRRPR